MRSTLCAIAAIPFLVAPAFAGDGVVELNKSCAVAGCFSGDAPNLPITIDGSAGRSYVLTSDLTQTDPNVTVLSVTAPDVTLDLHGFSIRGTNQCSGDGGGCSITGAGHGVAISADRVQVTNGTVVGMGSVGILATSGNGIVIRNVRVAHNRYQGISVSGTGNLLEGVTASLNGDVGMATGISGRVVGSSAFDNGLHGIQAAAGSSVESSTASSNGLDGIFIDSDGSVTDCTARENGRDGINFGNGASAIGRGMIRGCTSIRNGASGVIVWGEVLVADCALIDNGVSGLFATGVGVYRGNLIARNDVATVAGSPINAGSNTCSDNAGAVVTCP